MANLSNILLSKSYVGPSGSIIKFTFDVTDLANTTTKYQIYLNDVLLKENQLTATPYSVNEDIFISAGGALKITLTDVNNVVTNWDYTIYTETRDTFEIVRDFKYDTSVILNNAKIDNNTGIMLEDGKTIAELLTEIPTLGKAKLSNIIIDGSTDGVENVNINIASADPVDLVDYTEYSYPIDKTKYDTINSFTMDDNTNILTINATVHSYKTIQLSKDGITFVGYNGTEWRTDYKMSETELEALTVEEYLKFHSSAYEERLFIKIFLDSNNTVNPISVSKVTATFAANEPPNAKDINLSLSEIHNEETQLTAYLYDNEGDTIDYRVMMKNENDLDFSQITPSDGWISISNKTIISHIYNKNNFKLGNNVIKIQLRDQRGSIKDSNTINLQFVNEAPIQTSYVCRDFSLQALVDDANKDPLAYRIFINGVQKFPTSGYTTFQSCPRVIDYSWDSSDLKFGLQNEIKLEVIDEFGGKLEITSNVLGTYKGLLFKDENGNYYSTDKAEILKYIDLGKYIAGSTTIPKRVILENRTGGEIGNVIIKISEETIYNGIDMVISPSLTPFNGTKQITIPYTLNDKDEYNFYVKVKLDRYVERTGDVLLKLEVE